MPTSPTPDDLLALARFCWPHEAVWFCPESPAHVSAAEAVLIERGLGIRYIRQLAKALRFVPAPDGHRYSETDAMILATAPLESRVRAMVQVVRAEEAKRGE